MPLETSNPKAWKLEMNSNTFHSLHKTSAWATNILKLHLFFGKDSPTEQTIFLFHSN